MATTSFIERFKARRDSVKSTNANKRWIFPVVLIIAAIITWFWLFGAGMATKTPKGAFGAAIYAPILANIVTIFHVVINIYPTYLLIKKKAWWRLLVVGFMLIGMWLALVVGYIHLAGAALWGLRFPGVLALLLSAMAAYLLSRYAEEDQTLVEDVKRLPASKNAIQKQEDKVAMEASNVEEAKKAAKARSLESSNATHDAERASEDRTAKQQAYDNSLAVTQAADIDKEIKAKKTEQEDLTTERALLIYALSKSSGKSTAKTRSTEGTTTPVASEDAESAESGVSFDEKRDRLKVVDARLKELRVDIPQLEVKLKQKQDEAAASNEKKQLDAAAARSVKKSKKEKAKRDERDAAIEEERTATRAWKREQRKLTDMTGRRDAVLSRQEEAEETRRLMWRDDLFYPGVCAFFAILCYAAWYGWVVLEIH
jgi:hypothetical protein